MIDTRLIKTGTRVCNGSLKGVVVRAVRGSLYVSVAWDDRHGVDRLCRTSPLWVLLQVET